jgi:gluconolactonase
MNRLIATLRTVLLSEMILFACLRQTGYSQGGVRTVVAAGATLEKLFGGGEFTEGPAMGPDRCVYFSDLTYESGTRADGHIWKYDPARGSTVIFRSPSGMSNGIEFDQRGRMLVAVGSDIGGRGLLRTDLSTGKTEVMTSSFNGFSYNSPNDLTVDARGRIYFTDPRYGDFRSVRQPLYGVYRLDPDGSVALVASDVAMPNGVAVSPDQRTLYVGCFDEGNEDSTAGPQRGKTMAIFVYSLREDGTADGRRTLVDFAPRAGPDGMTVDREGNLFVAVRDEGRPGINVYSPDGTEISYIKTPEIPSNVAFSRPPADTMLYITAGGSLYRIRTNRHGYFPGGK